VALAYLVAPAYLGAPRAKSSSRTSAISSPRLPAPGQVNKVKNKTAISVADPVPFLPLDPGSGMGKKTGSGSGMNNLDFISESLQTNFLD
jgi:hypothetical protein